MQAQIRNGHAHLGPCSGQNLPWRKMIPQVRPGRQKTRGEAPGLVRFDYQFLLFTHFTHKTRNWGTGVKQIKAPGRPCYYFHPGMNHLSQMVRAEQGVTWADQRRIPTRVIYRAGTRPPKSGNTIPQNRGSCAFPRTVVGDARSHVCPQCSS